MTKQESKVASKDQFRRKAERLSEIFTLQRGSNQSSSSAQEMRELLHELYVHQIELEIQNEELRRMQEELEASRARLFDLFEMAPVGYLTLCAKGLIQNANLTAATLLGAPRSALLKQPFVRFVHIDDVDHSYRQQKTIHGTDLPLSCEVRIVKPDHSTLWAQLTIASLEPSDENSLSRLIITDITELKELELALQESEERYRYLFASASDALFIIDSQSGRIIDVNTRALELYQYSAGELIDTPCQNLAASQDSSCWFASEGLAHPNGVLIIPSHLHKKKDGTIFSVEITARCLPLGGQNRFFMAVRDNSERKFIESVMAARLRLLRAANERPLDELLQKTLDEAEALTRSQIGFFHFLNPDQQSMSLQSWSSNTLERQCKTDRTNLHYSLNQAGVWSECIHKRKPVIHNDYKTLPERKGLPKGHVEIVRELVVPVLRDHTVVALIGLGNKPTDYNQQDIQVVSTLADLAWDIALRKQAEMALRESEQQYRILFESASDALLFINADTIQITQVNEQAVTLYGYSRQDFSGMVATDLSAENDKTRRFLQQASQEPGAIFHVPMREHRKIDGTIFPVEITGRSLPYKGHPRLLISIRDISERVTADRALRMSERQRLEEQKIANNKLIEQAENLSSIYNALDNVGVIVCDLLEDDARIKVFNVGAEKMFGYPSKQVLGASIGLIYPHEDLNIIPAQVHKLRQGETIQFSNMALVRSSGERFPAVVSMNPFSREGGQFRRAIGIYRDISDLIITQLQLEAANEDLERRVEQRTWELQETQKQYLHAEKLSAIGKLSASIAHEFNNPLQGILAILKGLQKRAILEPEDRELLRAAIGESERIRELIRSLQEFNRPSAGKKSWLDIHKALDSLLLLHTNDFKKKRITVERHYAQQLPQIMAVSDQIKQVFLNLLTNAADACQVPGGRITLTTRHEENMVSIAIMDSGIGIPLENLETIFQPFFTTKPSIKGSGLGLSVSHGIITNHGGTITVESQPGEGATFTVKLPIKNELQHVYDSRKMPRE